MTTRRAAAAAAAALVAALTGCGGTAPATTPATTPAPVAASRDRLPHLVRGTFTAGLPNFNWNPGEGCWGSRQLAGVTAGTDVTVTDGTGAVVAMGKLDSGTVSMQTDGQRAQWCLWEFKVSDVPSGRGFYAVQIGDLPPQRYPEAELSQKLTLALQ